MAIRKSDDIANETDSKFNKSKGTEKLARIQERFDDTTENDNPYDDAIQYINKKLDEVVDETNTQKVSSPFPTITTKQENATITISSLQHIPAANDDAKDTLAITVQIVVGKTKTLKTFTLTAD
jgi:hypothetical protein